MATREQREQKRVDHRVMTDHDPADLGANALARIGRTLEEQGVATDDGRKGCQCPAFVLQACPMREAGLDPFTARELPNGSPVVVERPPPGLGRGIFVVSPLVVELVAFSLVLVTLAYYAFRLRRPRRR